MLIMVVLLLWFTSVLRTVNPYTCQSARDPAELLAAPPDGKPSVLVFGNGPCVNNAPKHISQLVDAFDEVVRFNGYELSPEVTGSKTTLVFYNGATKRPSDNIHQICSTCLENKGFVGFFAFGLVFRVLFGDGVDSTAHCLHPDVIQNTKSKMKFSRLQKEWFGPTSGVLAVDFLLQRYEVVHIHGFSFTNVFQGSEKHFYRQDPEWKDVISDMFHLPNHEREYIKSMIQTGRVKILDHSCGHWLNDTGLSYSSTPTHLHLRGESNATESMG